MPRSISSLPDTNVVLRYLLRDIPEQFEQAERFFEEVRTGREKAVILESVLVECIYILMKFYQVPKAETVEILTGLLQYKGIVNRDKAALVEALAMFAEHNVDVVDCVLLAKARQGGLRLFSFDKALNRLNDK